MIDKKIKSAKRWLGLLAAIIFGIILYSMTGCNSEKKLTAKAETFVTKYPVPAHEYFRGKFPCVLTKSDTTIFLTDTTFLVDCPDTARIDAAQYFTLDTAQYPIIKNVYYPGKTIKVPVTLPQKVVTIVQRWEDSSKVKEVLLHLQDVVKEREQYKYKNTHKGKVIIWLIVFLVGLLTPYVIKAVKFFTI